MGGWGTGSFENDDAQDFLEQLKSLGIDDLRPILARAADQEDYLEAPESSVAVVAAEVVAALVAAKGGGSSSPPQIMDWISKNQAAVPADLVDLARRAVARVRTNSELKDLWLEAEGLNEWSAELRDLEGRLDV
ncbi:MAG: DUF4259 domain-containing protein [Acidobacteriia bacterium]|nr:DUF4259 domain-containing protein [Terriglobia bacterium]